MIRYLLTALLCCFISITAFGQTSTGSLRGRVLTDKGKPVPDAFVTPEKGQAKPADKEGRFILNLQPGAQKVMVQAMGYSSRIFDINIEEGKEETLDVVLTTESILDEVVVTAGRKAESIREVPSSVTIVREKEIREQAAINPSITSILGNTVPGLGTFTNKATNAGQTLRGRSVLVLIDGIPQSTPLMNGSRDLRSIDPAVISRVEVIKGATSIYGNGSGGGIINMITKNPEGDKKISGETRIGADGNLFHSDNTLGYQLSQSLYGKINKFSYVVSGIYNRTGALKDADGNVIAQADGLSETRLFNGFAKLGYQINDKQSLTFSYNIFKSQQHAKYINKDGVYGVSPAYGVPGVDPGDPAGTPHSHNMYLSYKVAELPANTSLEVVLYDNRFQSLNRYVAKSTSWYGPGQTYIQSYKQGIRANLNTPWKTKFISGDVTYGLDVLKDRTNQVLTDGRIYVPDMNMLNVAPFAQVKADFHRLVLKGGVRYENDGIRVKDFNTIAKGPEGQGSTFIKGGKLNYNALMFNIGARYNRWNVFSPFVSFSQAFGLNELGRVLRTASENTLSQIQTDPVITNNYEAGFSSEFGPVNFSASYFISTSKLGANLVEQNGIFVTQREPERVYGYELVIDSRIGNRVKAGASYSFVEGKSKQADGEWRYMNGERIMPAKGTAFVNYQPVNVLNMQLSMVYTGSRDRFQPRANTGVYGLSEGPVKSVAYFNFNAGYRISSAFNLSMGIENLFNQAYYPPRSQYRVQNNEYVMGNGARMTLALGYKF
ncbi:iron complex outermembrane recepter protein [Chitinophaga terrae (ex Kim and Jung 2007)]|uniref:Iron complex outermembrane recepter protein n=1 Tax=Chitinophaga terrae (ex Kim and Jung 2007) TaxID=408074 RepID=A0A1H4EI00_9BACT|nr:TonB-dependent receptor plug domain-containing protein [Chitinophaga terrae (ex Kim and Jung 2007)]SEA83852.1 iron complex outermembrane recepter protein [Chitinophaga terrae (ex Kim and Jung 2007)]